MPLPDYRESAREAISRIKTRLIETGKAEYIEGATISLSEILKFDPTKTLLIIPCTSEKVWQIDPTAPDLCQPDMPTVERNSVILLSGRKRISSKRRASSG